MNGYAFVSLHIQASHHTQDNPFALGCPTNPPHSFRSIHTSKEVLYRVIGHRSRLQYYRFSVSLRAHSSYTDIKCSRHPPRSDDNAHGLRFGRFCFQLNCVWQENFLFLHFTHFTICGYRVSILLCVYLQSARTWPVSQHSCQSAGARSFVKLHNAATTTTHNIEWENRHPMQTLLSLPLLCRLSCAQKPMDSVGSYILLLPFP